MFVDARDIHGLVYWYDDVERQHRQIKELTPATT